MRADDLLPAMLPVRRDVGARLVQMHMLVDMVDPGQRNAEMLGRPSDLVFTPEDRAAGAPEKERAEARTNGRAEDERWHVRKNGSRFWGSGMSMPLASNAPFE